MSRIGFAGSFVLFLSAFALAVVASALLAPGIVQQLSSLDARLLARDWVVSIKSQFDLPGEPIEFEVSLVDRLAATMLQQKDSGPSEVNLFRPLEFQSLEHFGNIRGYAVFTKFGELFIAGGTPQMRDMSNVNFAKVAQDAMRHQKSMVFSRGAVGNKDKPSLIVLIPLQRLGASRGVISVEVERHHIEDVMERGVQFTGLVTAILLAVLSAIVMITLFYWGRQRRLAEREAIRLAFYDPLTGLPNRRRFHKDLPQRVALAAAQKFQFGLLSIDVDKFKQINDLYGHGAGDLVLMEIGKRLLEQVGINNDVYRLSGDEFVVILDHGFSSTNLAALCTKLVDAMKLPIEVEMSHIVASISIGAAVFPLHGDDDRQLLKRSDLALYHAKDAGRAGFTIYTPQLEEEQNRKALIERELRIALEVGGLELHYQPQVCAMTGRLMGFEALARWCHPKLGNISPDEFVSVAEQSGLIHVLGEWALATACKEAATWEYDDLTIAVNLSPLQLRDAQIVNCVRRVLAESRLSPHRLELEITEGVFVFDTAQVRHTLDELRALGVGIAMDDFGTGYSSLNYLTRIPLTKLKIDRSFVSNFHLGKADDAVVHCVIGLSKSLRLSVVAEGVENESQLQALQLAGCDILQGYYFGRPTNTPKAFIVAAYSQSIMAAG